MKSAEITLSNDEVHKIDEMLDHMPMFQVFGDSKINHKRINKAQYSIFWNNVLCLFIKISREYSNVIKGVTKSFNVTIDITSTR